MKNINMRILLFLIPFFACKDVLFIPEKGTINGYITDNNAMPVAGVSVSATFTPPSLSEGQPSFPTTLVVTTDNDGYYQLSELWDDVTISISQPGFESVSKLVALSDNEHTRLDFALSGSPTIESISLSNNVLSANTADTVVVSLSVLDVFNNISTGYLSNIILKNSNGSIAAIVAATIQSQGLKQYLFAAKVTASDLPLGTFDIYAEVQDPDGNIHQIDAGQSLQVQ